MPDASRGPRRVTTWCLVLLLVVTSLGLLGRHYAVPPIQRWWFLRSNPYSEQPLIIVIAGGRSGGREYRRFRSRLESFGMRIDNQVKIETAYLLALDGYEKTQSFDLARKLGIPIVRPDELRGALALGIAEFWAHENGRCNGCARPIRRWRCLDP